MSCNNPHTACPIVSCYSNIYVGKIADLNTTVTVVIENTGTGRRVVEDVTSDGSGVLVLTSGTLRKFLTGFSGYRLSVLKGGVPQDITMYLTDSTFDTSTFNAIDFETFVLREADGDMYLLTNQYLIKSV